MILILLVIVYFWKKEQLEEAFQEILEIPAWVNLLMLLAALVYFVWEGRVISDMTMADQGKALSWFRGICCSFYCEFYRLITVGSATAVAQIFYYHTYGVTVPRATGLCLVQYTIQKAAICVLGTVSFLILVLIGQPGMLHYTGFVLAGIGITAVVVAVLMVIALSEKNAELVIRLTGRVLKKYPEKQEHLAGQIRDFHREGRMIYQNRKQLGQVILLDFLKLAGWYFIPAILFTYTDGGNPLEYAMIMAVVNMLSGVMIAPAGVGTLEYVFGLFYKPLVGNTSVSGVILYRFYIWFIPFFIGAVAAAGRKKQAGKPETADPKA